MRLIALIEPHYPEAGRGRRPHQLEKMLQIYFLQQWFDLSDPGAEEALYDSGSMRCFVGVELGRDVVPDETTILKFRHFLETHDLAKAMFGVTKALLKERGLLLRQAPSWRDEEDVLYGDAAYRSKTDRRSFLGANVRYRTNHQAQKSKSLTPRQKRLDREYSRVRSRAEHAFCVV